MMLSAALARTLADAGFGVFAEDGTATVFYDVVPADPDACLSVMSFGDGTAPQAGVGEYDTTMQVRVRGTAGDSRWPTETAAAVMETLLDRGWETWATGTPDEVFIVRAQAGTPYPLGWDDTDRYEAALRVRLRVRV